VGNFLSFVFLGLLCIVLQSTLIAYLGVGGLRIELLLVMITYIALFHPTISGCFLAVVLGYIYDLNSAAPLGLHIMTFLSCFLILNMSRDRLFIQGPAFCMGLTTGIVFLHQGLQFLFLSSRGVSAWPGFSSFVLYIPMALLTGCLWPILSGMMVYMDRIFPLPYQPRSRRQTGLQFKY
jgi:rod shape-determining protein MreD